MALIAMTLYSTVENGKDEYLKRTLASLKETVNFDRHRLFLSINGTTPLTMSHIADSGIPNIEIIKNEGNIGTAEAINNCWFHRRDDEACIKMDDDIVFNKRNWADDLEDAAACDPTIGQIGCKRRDCIETPCNTNPFYKSELIMLPHQPGQKWFVVEKCNHIMGSAVLHTTGFLKKCGYLYQLGPYGFDDSFASLRANLAGLKTVFLMGIDIEHIDRGDTMFQTWKEKEASSHWVQYHQTVDEYRSGKKSLYYNPFQINPFE